MTAIARKSSFFYLTHLGTFSIPLLGILLGLENRLMLFAMPLWTPAWLSSSVLWSERQESYAFLRTLPVTDRQIVRTKFGLGLGFTFLYWMVMFLAGRWAWPSAPDHASYIALADLACAASLVLVAGWYIFSWRFGPSLLSVAAIAFTLIVVMGTLVVNIERMVRTRGIGVLSPRWLAEAPWFYHLLLMAAALAAYYGLMRVAIKVKTKSEA